MSRLFSKRSDHVLDMRSQRPSTRSDFGHGNLEPDSKKLKMILYDNDEDDQPVDEDYKRFLYALEKYCKEPPSLEEEDVEEEEEGKEGEEANEGGDDSRDPQYKMFMENLREDENSYILQMSKDDVMTVCIKYEGEDNRPSGGSGYNWATPREEDKTSSATPRGKNKVNLETSVEDGIASREEDRRNSAIPREDIKTSALPSKENRENSATPREEDRRKSAAHREEDRRNSAAHREEDGRHSASSREKDWMNAVKMENTQSLEVPCSKLNILKEVKMKKSGVNCVSNGAEGGSNVNSESSQVLLNRRKLEDIAANLLTKECKQLKRNNNDGETLLHTRQFVSNAAKCVYRPLHGKRSTGRGHYQFREELMATLRMPFSQRDYEELLQEFTNRKRKQHHRELRGGIKIYYSSSPGKSYSDYYPDLAKKINFVRFDRPKVLNLLRGFFYWLKNLSLQGAFPPWLDSSYLQVVMQDPSSSQLV